jgi:hypothetical protein
VLRPECPNPSLFGQSPPRYPWLSKITIKRGNRGADEDKRMHARASKESRRPKPVLITTIATRAWHARDNGAGNRRHVAAAISTRVSATSSRACIDAAEQGLHVASTRASIAWGIFDDQHLA